LVFNERLSSSKIKKKKRTRLKDCLRCKSKRTLPKRRVGSFIRLKSRDGPKMGEKKRCLSEQRRKRDDLNAINSSMGNKKKKQGRTDP